MALIECKDCGQQISDSAESCPKCGAPVPKTIGTDEEQCPNCRAVKGYMYESRYGVMGKTGVVIWGVIVPIAITIPLPIVGIVTIPLALYAIYRLVTGPRWFQRRAV